MALWLLILRIHLQIFFEIWILTVLESLNTILTITEFLILLKLLNWTWADLRLLLIVLCLFIRSCAFLSSVSVYTKIKFTNMQTLENTIYIHVYTIPKYTIHKYWCKVSGVNWSPGVYDWLGIKTLLEGFSHGRLPSNSFEASISWKKMATFP